MEIVTGKHFLANTSLKFPGNEEFLITGYLGFSVELIAVNEELTDIFHGKIVSLLVLPTLSDQFGSTTSMHYRTLTVKVTS